MMSSRASKLHLTTCHRKCWIDVSQEGPVVVSHIALPAPATNVCSSAVTVDTISRRIDNIELSISDLMQGNTLDDIAPLSKPQEES